VPRAVSYDEKKKADAEARKARKDAEARQRRVSDLESRIASAEGAIKELEATMSAPGFYENHETAKPIIDRHQALMWEVGDLMNKWETLQAETEV
jgi:ATP-binding cassette subfamily F protein 3